jgi:hypothetical protein
VSRTTEIVFEGDGAALGVFGPLVVAVTNGPNSFHPINAQRVVDHIARLRRTTHAKQLVYVYVAGERSELPGAEARKITAELGEIFDACIGVHEGAGFRASAIRAVVVGISMASRRRVRPEVVSTIGDGAERVAARFPEIGAAADIRRAIERVHAAATAAS